MDHAGCLTGVVHWSETGETPELMHTKIFFLFFLVLFGAYAEFQAGKTIKRLKNREKRPSQQDTIPTGIDSTSVRQSININQFKKVGSNRKNEANPAGRVQQPIQFEALYSEGEAVLMGTLTFGLKRIGRVFYCISEEEITSFAHHLKAMFNYQALSDVEHVRNIQEMSIPQESARSRERWGDWSGT